MLLPAWSWICFAPDFAIADFAVTTQETTGTTPSFGTSVVSCWAAGTSGLLRQSNVHSCR